MRLKVQFALARADFPCEFTLAYLSYYRYGKVCSYRPVMCRGVNFAGEVRGGREVYAAVVCD